MYKLLTLKNQAKLILASRHETKAVTVLVLFKVGSRNESQKLNGLSHFLEHMLFKGTKRRPNTLAISRALDQVGADYNAFTTKDHTGFYIKVYHKKIELAIDMLSDILFHSKFSPEEMKKEKGVIIEEINMYEDNPLLYIEDLMERTLFGSGSLGRLIIGPRENIRGFSRGSLVKYHQTFYQPKNMLLAVAGQYEEPRVLELINKYFIGNNAKARIPKISKFKIRQRKPQVTLKYQKTEQVQLGLGFPAFSYFDKNLYSLYLLSVILGGSMSSRLFIEVREKRGLCYYIKTMPNVYEDTGLLYIQAGLDKTRIFEALGVLWQELVKIRKQGVTPAELKRAKDFIKGKLVLELEESSEIAAFLAKQQLMTGKIEKPEEKFKKIDTVTLGSIKKAAHLVIQKKLINLVVIGPFTRKNEFRRFIDQNLK
ncbi:MAG: pitrilysin family protein [Patescibacteria group bacterium]